MELVMSGLTYDICLVYLDDILVFSKTFKEHCDRLATIFDHLEQYTLKLKLWGELVKMAWHVGQKCQFSYVSTYGYTKEKKSMLQKIRAYCGVKIQDGVQKWKKITYI